MSVTQTKQKTSRWDGLMKVEIIRRLCKEMPELRKKTNPEIQAVFKQQTGLDVTHSTIVDSIGTYRARIKTDNGEIIAALNKLMELCSYDEKLARSSFRSFLRQFRKMKRKPVVSTG